MHLNVLAFVNIICCMEK